MELGSRSCFLGYITTKNVLKILDLSILLSICRAYKYLFGWLCRATCCSVVSTSMLGVSHAVQNEHYKIGPPTRNTYGVSNRWSNARPRSVSCNIRFLIHRRFRIVLFFSHVCFERVFCILLLTAPVLKEYSLLRMR